MRESTSETDNDDGTSRAPVYRMENVDYFKDLMLETYLWYTSRDILEKTGLPLAIIFGIAYILVPVRTCSFINNRIIMGNFIFERYF